MKHPRIGLATWLLAPALALAQPPYGEFADRDIKALSAAETEGLRNGAGLGMALPAELNGWPGPKHVLELADELGLSPDVRKAVEHIRAEMNAEARALGEELIAAERDLDTLFAAPEEAGLEARLATAVDRAAAVRGRLRFAHLRAHLATRPLLTAEQRSRYEHLRRHAGEHRPGAGHVGH